MNRLKPQCPFDAFPEVLVPFDEQTIPDKCRVCIVDQSFKPDDSKIFFDREISSEAEDHRALISGVEQPLFLYAEKITDQTFELSLGMLEEAPDDTIGWWSLQCISKAYIDCVNYQPKLF